jgi:hypothetical protein
MSAASRRSENKPAATIWNSQSPSSLMRVLQDRGPVIEAQPERPAFRMPLGYLRRSMHRAIVPPYSVAEANES